MLKLHKFKVGDVVEVSFDGVKELQKGQWLESVVRATQGDRMFLAMDGCCLIFKDQDLGRITHKCSIYFQPSLTDQPYAGFSGPIDLGDGSAEGLWCDWPVIISKVS